MSNAYVTALNARIEVAVAKNSRASNIDMLKDLAARVAEKDFAKLLREAKIDARAFSEAIYASEKLVKFCYALVNKNTYNVNANALAAFKTAMNFAKAEKRITRDAIRSALSKSVKLNDDTKALVVQRDQILSENTLDAQYQQCIAMLYHMHILDSSNKRDRDFAVTRNALAEALSEHFKIASV